MSQLTSLAVLGIDERRFRETFGKHPNASRVGKLLVIDVADARETLRSLRTTHAGDGAERDDDGPQTIDDVLAKLGRRRVRRSTSAATSADPSASTISARRS